MNMNRTHNDSDPALDIKDPVLRELHLLRLAHDRLEARLGVQKILLEETYKVIRDIKAADEKVRKWGKK